MDTLNFKNVQNNKGEINMTNNITIGKEFKKFALKDWEQFSREGFIIPPNFENEKWFEENHIYILSNKCAMELEYDADTVNELDFSLKEIHRAVLGDGTPTTGNTIGSKYPNATGADILKLNIMKNVYYKKMTFQQSVHDTIKCFNYRMFQNCMHLIKEKPSLLDTFHINFNLLDTSDLDNIFDDDQREWAIRNMLCQHVGIDISESGDKTFLVDYSIDPTGHFVGWHYGVATDMNDACNQELVKDYINNLVD